MQHASSFGYWVRRQRKALDLTQQVLAERVGCSLAAIKKIESDERRPSRQIAERLAEILRVPPEQRDRFLESARGLGTVERLPLSQVPVGGSLPSGTVTFLYTDIEGSTRLWAQHPEAMTAAHARHDEILREAIKSCNGYVFQVVGDSFCAAFHNAEDALRAARDSQLLLHVEDWGQAPIRVRMGLHTGKAEVQADGSYQGYVTLSYVQHLMSAAQGGQVLISSETYELARDQPQEGGGFRDLGEHRLRGFDRAERVFQLVLAGLQADFPPLDSLSGLPNNLPVQLSSFIGREHELAEVKQLLANTRLLTFTGPGGTGKTRLALRLATDMLEAFDRGVWLVELAPLNDPSLVPQSVASALGVREQPGRTVLDALMDYVRTKTLLIVLDNCEHLIGACARIADSLLRSAPGLKILATSREALGIAGEMTYRVPSLPLPDQRASLDLNTVAQNDCVRLFVERALSVYPPFRLKDKNAPAIIDLCRRLDGIPLAIELAAARTRVFPPEEIAARLDDRFRLLTGGSRTALERHQTLFALIEWSHNLLSEPERALLRRLSVFSGGWSFEAAQWVCGGVELGGDILDLLTHLVDKSLVAVEEETEEARYHLPETIRQHARDKLYESGEAGNIRDRHLDYFLSFAEKAESKLRSAEQLEWLERVGAEYDNLRTALAWSLETNKSSVTLRLAGALCYFWVLRGIFSESYRWLNDALALAEREQSEKAATGEYIATPVEMAQRAKALYGATLAQFATLDVKKGRTLIDESLRLWRELGNKWWIAVALELKALLLSVGPDFEVASACLEEGIALGRQTDDSWPLAVCLIRMGDALKPAGRAAEAIPFLEEGVALARRIGDRSVLSEGTRELGSLYYTEGDLPAAESLTQEALANRRAIGGLISVFLALFQLVVISCLQNDPAKAKQFCLEAWALGKDTGSAFVAMFALLSFGLVAIVGGDPGRGVRLLAASEVMLAQVGFKPGKGDAVTKVVRQELEEAQVQLGPEAFQGIWAEGQHLTLADALVLAEEIAK